MVFRCSSRHSGINLSWIVELDSHVCVIDSLKNHGDSDAIKLWIELSIWIAQEPALDISWLITTNTTKQSGLCSNQRTYMLVHYNAMSCNCSTTLLLNETTSYMDKNVYNFVQNTLLFKRVSVHCRNESIICKCMYL